MTTTDVNGTDVTVKKSKTMITSLLPIWSETPKMDLFSSETDFETETQSSFWESGNMYNPDFNSIEFDGIKNEAWLNRFALSVKQWSERVNSRGIIAKAGRYGGTYAHKDIAFEFASWISPQFNLYLVKEFQRLKRRRTKTTRLGHQA
ncbi:MAG TPA: KilA-N domain-containing protein [Methanocorpusculum sp.]|nr:KilA-N domain-containing protein [Methanocorpusculum sp.]